MKKIKAQIVNREIEGKSVEIIKLHFPAQLKAVGEDGKMVIEGYCSVFGNLDSYFEIVDKGAFVDFLRTNFPRYPKLIWAHNWEEPIGITLEAREDDHGLFVRGELTPGVQRAEEAYKLIKAGAITDLSFGFRVDEDSIDQGTGARHLKKISIYEWSPVLVGANPQAGITAFKSAIGREISEEEIKAILVKDEEAADPKPETEPAPAPGAADPEPKPEDPPADPAPADPGEGGKAQKVLSVKARALAEEALVATETLKSALEALISATDEAEPASSASGVDQRGRGKGDAAKVVKLIQRDARQADKILGRILVRAKQV